MLHLGKMACALEHAPSSFMPLPSPTFFYNTRYQPLKRNKSDSKSDLAFDPSRELWVGCNNNKTIVPRGAQLPLLQFIHEMIPWAIEKIIAWGSQYFWTPSPTRSQMVCSWCSICPKHNPGKPLHGSQGPCALPTGPS